MRAHEYSGGKTGEQGRRWLGAGLLALLLLVGLGGIACVRRAHYPQVAPAASGEFVYTLEQAGLSRVLIPRTEQTPPWKSLVLHNGGDSPVRGIRLWGLGGTDLLLSPSGMPKGQTLFQPFNMLPGEQFACSTLEEPGQGSQLSGLFFWEPPKDGERLDKCLRANRKTDIGPDGTLVLKPGGGEAYIEMEFSAPLPHKSARLAWNVSNPQWTPKVWVNVNGDAWGLVSQPRPRPDWLHPVDLTDSIKGTTHFWLRLSYEPRRESARAEDGQAPKELALLQLRVEREVQGPGGLRGWKPGMNELSVSVAAPIKPQLDLRLLGGQ